MRRALFAIGFLALVALFAYMTWRGNTFSDAPLKWKITLDQYEGVHHVDKDSIYCAANVSAVWGSISSLCRMERVSGKMLWRRKKSFNGDLWENEDPRCWATDTCYASSNSFDRSSGQTSNNRITAISLHRGAVLWEEPVSEEVRSLALGELLYCITNDGRFATYQPKTGTKVSELDLRGFATPRASYGGIQLFGSIAIVGSNLSHDYTNPEHARVFLLNLKTNRLIEELPKGELIDGKYVIYTGKEWQSFDLSADEPKGVLMNLPERSSPMTAFDYSGAVWTQFASRGWQLLNADAQPISPEFGRGERLMHIAGDTLYVWDYRTLRSVNRYTGAIAWSVPIARIDNVSASSLQVLVRCRGDTLFCFDSRTGALKWKYRLNEQMGSPAWCDGNEVIVSESAHLLRFGG